MKTIKNNTSDSTNILLSEWGFFRLIDLIEDKTFYSAISNNQKANLRGMKGHLTGHNNKNSSSMEFKKSLRGAGNILRKMNIPDPFFMLLCAYICIANRDIGEDLFSNVTAGIHLERFWI